MPTLFSRDGNMEGSGHGMSNELALLCGSELPDSPVTSSGNRITMGFVSHMEGVNTGFEIRWERFRG